MDAPVILNTIEGEEAVSVSQMAYRLKISRRAARRQLNRLSKTGLLNRKNRGDVSGARVLYWKPRSEK